MSTAKSPSPTGAIERDVELRERHIARQQPSLTPDGFDLINERIADIHQRRLPALRPLLVEHERDERDVAAFESLLAEVVEWEAVLAQAQVLAPPEFVNLTEVGLGSRVHIAYPDGETMWVRPVHPREAFLDDERISVASPLGAALMGAVVGAQLQVPAPTGSWCATVRAIE
jgi:transcription elongation GreA/GreB family factor